MSALARDFQPLLDESRLEALIDWERIVGAGWNEHTAVFAPDPLDPLLGYKTCERTGCDAETTGARCRACTANLDRDLELADDRLCLVCCVPGFERPAYGRHRLCKACWAQCSRLGLTEDEYAAGGAARPVPAPRRSIGACRAAVCRRPAAIVGTRLCKPHSRVWREAGCPDLAEWATWAEPVQGDRAGRVHLAGLDRQIHLEVLFGIQDCFTSGRRRTPSHLRALASNARSQRIRSLAQLNLALVNTEVERFVRQTLDAIDLASRTREEEVKRDTWDLRLWGLSGTLQFNGIDPNDRQRRGAWARTALPITQPWLRQAAKDVAVKTLSRVESVTGLGVMVIALGQWSKVLARREDQGLNMEALSRSDLHEFLTDLGVQERAGDLSFNRRAIYAGKVRAFLREARETGLAAPGGPLHGLAASVALTASEVPQRSSERSDEDEIGSSLPAAIVSQMLRPENLAQLAPDGVSRLTIGLEVGRRPGELCNLTLDCLGWDETVDPDSGETRRLPVLLFAMPKVRKTDCRLPISSRVATLIEEQQAAVAERYPMSDRSKLRLFPRTHMNPYGHAPFTPGAWRRELQLWAAQLDLVDGVVDANGNVQPRTDPITKQPVPFPTQDLKPYALRHTYAQRHIDAGTPVEVLKELLGHARVTTTQAYYRITAGRRRDAVSKLATMRFAVSGPDPIVGGLSDSDSLRYEVGQVAVPFGVCVEPSNVQASGGACEFRHRCFGCRHFRTDPSYLEELRGYLVQLLADQERLAAHVPELAEWARADARPSTAEVTAVRSLIASCEGVLDGLSPDDKVSVAEAISVLRSARQTLDATYPIELRSVVAQPSPTVFPVTFRETQRG